MLATQNARIQLEMKHAEVALREVDHNQRLADKSIEAQAEDRKDERRLYKAMHTQRVLLLAGVVIVVFIFLTVAMYMNKDALARDILQVLLGAVGGFGVRAATEKKSKDGQESTD